MLTFAQFERELSSERTKDKMYQRAEKGMWNGGRVPYGYDRKDKKLVVNKTEARIVTEIFETYIESGSLADTYTFLKQKGLRNRGGQQFTKSVIFYILRSSIYIGKIKYGKKTFS